MLADIDRLVLLVDPPGEDTPPGKRAKIRAFTLDPAPLRQLAGSRQSIHPGPDLHLAEPGHSPLRELALQGEGPLPQATSTVCGGWAVVTRFLVSRHLPAIDLHDDVHAAD